MTDQETAEFLPFHAINEYMRDDYRLQVVRSALAAASTLPAEYQQALDALTRRLVTVPGFRNSSKAPMAKRVRPTVDAFTKSPHLVAVILSAWAEAHADLRQKVHDLLSERNWDLLPVDADRTQLPGFFIDWPHGDDFDTLYQAFQAKYPDDPIIQDDVSLMVVWLAARLPVHHHDHDEDDEEENESVT